jgi:hypothetical protein
MLAIQPAPIRFSVRDKMPNPAVPDEFTELCADAHATFKESTGADPRADGPAIRLAGCRSSSVLSKLDGQMTPFEDFPSRRLAVGHAPQRASQAARRRRARRQRRRGRSGVVACMSAG